MPTATTADAHDLQVSAWSSPEGWDARLLAAINHFFQSHCRADVVDRDGEWKRPSDLHRGGRFHVRTPSYSAASFSFFSGRTLRRTEAGFAANHLSSPVNGSLPKRFFLAGTSCATTFSKPGSVNSFAPFL